MNRSRFLRLMGAFLLMATLGASTAFAQSPDACIPAKVDGEVGCLPDGEVFKTFGMRTAGELEVGEEIKVVTAVGNMSYHQITDVLVDVEIYDEDGNKVYQEYSDDQTFGAANSLMAPGRHNRFQIQQLTWTPEEAGTYTVKIGVFSNGWALLYAWHPDVGTIVVE